MEGGAAVVGPSVVDGGGGVVGPGGDVVSSSYLVNYYEVLF